MNCLELLLFIKQAKQAASETVVLVTPILLYLEFLMPTLCTAEPQKIPCFSIQLRKLVEIQIF